MTSAENSILEPPNLKFFWRRITPDPPKRHSPSALAVMPPIGKKQAMALHSNRFKTAMPESKSCTGTRQTEKRT